MKHSSTLVGDWAAAVALLAVVKVALVVGGTVVVAFCDYTLKIPANIRISKQILINGDFFIKSSKELIEQTILN